MQEGAARSRRKLRHEAGGEHGDQRPTACAVAAWRGRTNAARRLRAAMQATGARRWSRPLQQR
jgi:hypothetical protein